MIGSFWNLCRACPSMPVDKLHSEYRSTYRWHEYTGGPEVIRRPPLPQSQLGSSIEPPLPRRKKCPELAYKTHEFISCDEPDNKLPTDNNRARSEERGGTPSRRSKSEGPPGSGRPICPIPNGVIINKEEPLKKSSGQAVAVHELEPLFKDSEEKPHEKKHFEKFVSDKERYGFESTGNKVIDNKNLANGHLPNETWYKDVIELRKKADEYKCRGWGMEIDPDLYKKQKDVWEQVSRRSSLSALSLASVARPITKEEKEKENNKKSSPTKQQHVSRFPGHALPVGVDNKRRNLIRHHLERTTGADVEEGTILPSPTREKLMPAIPKSREEESFNSQKGSPKKGATSRHTSPQKGQHSPKKSSNKGRSQSIGPGVVHNESPKRQPRSGSSNANTTSTPTSAKSHKKTPVSTPTTERRPRPNDDYVGNDVEHDRSVSCTSPMPPQEITEHIVKSPPEPTRVKSPEQILMRSPDPVNWTVPLDTGKTFTVTQNVRNGDILNRPQSEFKASTPIDKPPPAPMSAPPELAEQAKMEEWTSDNLNDNMKMDEKNDNEIVDKKQEDVVKEKPQEDLVRFDKPVPGSTLRCLDDPTFDTDNASTTTNIRNAATDVLEKARDRFDRFWAGNTEENV